METYGFIQVKLLKEELMAMYTVRTFQVHHTRVIFYFIIYLIHIIKYDTFCLKYFYF